MKSTYAGKCLRRKCLLCLGFKDGQLVESLSFCWFCFLKKKPDLQIQHLCRAFEHNFARRGTGIWTIFLKFKCPGVSGGGMSKLWIHQHTFLGNSRPRIYLSPHTSSWPKSRPRNVGWVEHTSKKFRFFSHNSVTGKIKGSLRSTFVMGKNFMLVYLCVRSNSRSHENIDMSELMQKLPFLVVTFFFIAQPF